MKTRFIITILVLFFYPLVESMSNTVNTVVLGNAAGLQFDSNNMSYFTFNGIMSLIGRYSSIIDMGLVIILLITWVPFIVTIIKQACEESPN